MHPRWDNVQYMPNSTTQTRSAGALQPESLASEASSIVSMTSEPLRPSVVEQTVIAATPIAGPDEYYPAGTVATLARVLVGQQLDHYQLHELIGGGGMGAVFRATDTRLDRIVAVKVIPNLNRDRKPCADFVSKRRARPSWIICTSLASTMSARPILGATLSSSMSRDQFTRSDRAAGAVVDR